MGFLSEINKEECKIGGCDRCNQKEVEVIANGYIVGFLCEPCYKFVYSID